MPQRPPRSRVQPDPAPAVAPRRGPRRLACRSVTAVTRFVLASQSPARLKTLRNAGLDPEVMISGVDESTVTGPPADVALTLAVRKAMAVVPQIECALVLGCDSVLDLGGEALGKPTDRADAIERWGRMRGRSGTLHTGHCLVDTSTNRQTAAVASTIVHFADLADAEIAAYVDSGEPLAVAGAFTIDGLGGAFVERIEGDPHNVVGLSLPLLRVLAAELGHRWTDLWSRGS
ncbi:MAG: Maf family protein [Actinomycetes bacterium]